MGKATIIKNNSKGLYDIQLDLNFELIEKKISALNDKMNEAEDSKQWFVFYKEQQLLQKLLENKKTISAWCADLSDNLSGEVETIEINGEPQKILLAPQSPNHTKIKAGILTPLSIQSAAQSAFHFAIHAGWQRFLPTYRIGKITKIENGLCSVTLDDVKSFYGKLNINKFDKLENVPVKYMTCNSNAFNLGDRVVIEFEEQDWLKPQIIGFEKKPKPCKTDVVVIVSSFSGDEAFAWGLLSNSLILAKDSLSEIFSKLVQKGYEIPVEALPSGSEIDINPYPYQGSVGQGYAYDGILNLPYLGFFGSPEEYEKYTFIRNEYKVYNNFLDPDIFTVCWNGDPDDKHNEKIIRSYKHYYIQNPDNESDIRAPYVFSFTGIANLTQKEIFESMSGALWPKKTNFYNDNWYYPDDPIPIYERIDLNGDGECDSDYLDGWYLDSGVFRQCMFLHSMFGPELSFPYGEQINEMLKLHCEKMLDTWEDFNWFNYGAINEHLANSETYTYDSNSGHYFNTKTTASFLNCGIAKVESANLTFEYAGICAGAKNPLDGYDEESEQGLYRFNVFLDYSEDLTVIEKNVIKYINEERESRGLQALKVERNLQKIATDQALYQASEKVVAHEDENGNHVYYRAQHESDYFLNYPNDYGGYAVAENVAGGDVAAYGEDIAKQVVIDWMSSPGHRENILYVDFIDTGISVKFDKDKIYFCNTFGFKTNGWGGFSAISFTDAADYMINNFNNANAADKYKIPRVFLTNVKKEP